MHQNLLTIDASLAALVLSLRFTTLVPAKHAECYCRGPGTGTPQDQGFSKFCTAPLCPPPAAAGQKGLAIMVSTCNEFANHPLVADWNNLKDYTWREEPPSISQEIRRLRVAWSTAS